MYVVQRERLNEWAANRRMRQSEQWGFATENPLRLPRGNPPVFAGHTSNRLWNVYSDVATQGTTLVETTVIPETNFTITQGTMTITEAGNSVH